MYDFRLLVANRQQDSNRVGDNYMTQIFPSQNNPAILPREIMPSQNIIFNQTSNFTNFSQDEYFNLQQQGHITQVNLQSPFLDSISFHNSQFFSQYTEGFSPMKEEKSAIENTFQLRDDYDLETKPHLRLSQYKLNSLTNEAEVEQVYYLTPFGLKGSRRRSKDQELKIGRMELDENGEISNDIFLGDRTVSRLHCRIEYKDGFKKLEPLSKSMLSLFMMNHWRLGRNLNVPHLDSLSIYNICTYITKKRQFYLKDSGSVLGSFIRIKKNQSIEIKEGQILGIGNEYILVINLLYFSDIQTFKLKLQEEFKDGSHIYNSEDISQDNLKYLTYLKVFVNPIIGDQSERVILIPRDGKFDFLIGRNSQNDIHLNCTTISREHSMISYIPEENKWLIMDGNKSKESLNGTWLSITNAFDKINRSESVSYPLSHGDEIKISEFLFKVEEVNIEKYYNK